MDFFFVLLRILVCQLGVSGLYRGTQQAWGTSAT